MSLEANESLRHVSNFGLVSSTTPTGAHVIFWCDGDMYHDS